MCPLGNLPDYCDEFVKLLVRDPNWEDERRKREILFVGGDFPTDGQLGRPAPR